VCCKYVKSQKARGRYRHTSTHTRHKHSVEYDEVGLKHEKISRDRNIYRALIGYNV
jgi:hypothetical protein